MNLEVNPFQHLVSIETKSCSVMKLVFSGRGLDQVEREHTL